MAIIQPDGLFNGGRLRACSDTARLYWPYLFLASNGFGRLEIDYETIKRTYFVDFRKFLKPSEFFEILREYRDNGLLFLYQAEGGRAWGQWDAKEGSLPKFKTGKDRKSPEPPAEEYQKWRKEFLLQRQALTNISELFGNISKTSEDFEKFPIGVGVGIGVGKESTLTSAKETPPPAAGTPTGKRFKAPTPEEVREYAGSLGASIDAERFCDHHASKGWMIGRSPMKDWHAAVRTWLSNDRSTPLVPAAEKKTAAQLLIEQYERQDREEEEKRNAHQNG